MEGRGNGEWGNCVMRSLMVSIAYWSVLLNGVYCLMVFIA